MPAPLVADRSLITPHGASVSPVTRARPLRPADEPILSDLLRYGLMSPAQVARLRYAPGARTYAYARLKELADSGHLVAVNGLRPARRGSGQICYVLAPSSIKHLRLLGLDVPRRYKATELTSLSYVFFAHILAGNDVLIAAELLARDTPHVEVETLTPERALKRELRQRPLKVTLPDGTETGIEPDGWLSLLVAEADSRFRYPIALEVVRTSERTDWQRKVLAYVVGIEALLAHFGVPALTVAVTTPSQAKRDKVLAWTQDVLAKRSDPRITFRVTGADPVGLSPLAFFAGAHWYHHSQEAPLPLFRPKGAA